MIGVGEGGLCVGIAAWNGMAGEVADRVDGQAKSPLTAKLQTATYVLRVLKRKTSIVDNSFDLDRDRQSTVRIVRRYVAPWWEAHQQVVGHSRRDYQREEYVWTVMCLSEPSVSSRKKLSEPLPITHAFICAVLDS